MLVGRRPETAELASLLDRTDGGLGGARSVIGPAGSGKTALLDWFSRAAAARGSRVLRATGVEAESDLPWAGLAAICLERADLFDRLPGPQGRALRRALALDDDDAGIDRLAVSLGALGVLSAVAREAPLVVVVDDLQWIDPESRRALGFLARRLDDDPVALVVASRLTGDVVGEGALVLAGLEADDMADLLRTSGVAASGARDAITELAGGSPLLALQLARGLDPDQRRGSRPVPESLRVPAEVSDVYEERLARLGDDARQALAVVAADTMGDGNAALAALEPLGLSPADLDGAEELGLVTVEAGRVRFTHPLARTAVYEGVSGRVRRRAHAALAGSRGVDPAQGILHRAAAAVGSDPEVAEALAGLADDALRRGAAMTAASRGAQAAALTGSPTRRASLLVGAARAALVAGEPRRAGELLADARTADAERATHLDARRIEIRLAVAAGEIDSARAQVEDADAAYADTDPVAVAELLGEVARPLLPVAPFVAAPLTERLWELVADSTDRTAVLYAEVLYGCGRFVQGDLEGAARHIAVWPELLRLEGPVVAGPFLAESVVLYQGYSYQVGAALELLDEVEGQLRRHAPRGHWSRCSAHGACSPTASTCATAWPPAVRRCTCQRRRTSPGCHRWPRPPWPSRRRRWATRSSPVRCATGC